MNQSSALNQGLTQDAGLAQIHVHALQTSVAVPRRHPLTAVTGNDHVKQVAVTGDEHVHLRNEHTHTRTHFIYNIFGLILFIFVTILVLFYSVC